MHAAILNHIRSMGYAVSEHHLPASLLGRIGPAVEMPCDEVNEWTAGDVLE